MATSLIEFKEWGFGMQFQQHMWYMGNQVVVSVPVFELKFAIPFGFSELLLRSLN